MSERKKEREREWDINKENERLIKKERTRERSKERK